MPEQLVKFQGTMVRKSYRDAYMSGYNNPYKSNTIYMFEDSAYQMGKIARRQDDCREGTF